MTNERGVQRIESILGSRVERGRYQIVEIGQPDGVACSEMCFPRELD